MCRFHYNFIQRTFAFAQLLYTDTDSLTYHITTEDVYEDLKPHLQLFDTSDYPPDHPLYSSVNKKVMGKMKDETAGVPIQEFVGLRSKMYSMLYNNQAKKKAKGI